MKLIALLISAFLLSGYATADYYKYLANKDNLAFEYKKLELSQGAETYKAQLELKRWELDNKRIDNDRYLKDKELDNKVKELNTQLEIEKVRSDKEQVRLAQEKELKEKEIIAEQKKYEF